MDRLRSLGRDGWQLRRLYDQLDPRSHRSLQSGGDAAQRFQLHLRRWHARRRQRQRERRGAGREVGMSVFQRRLPSARYCGALVMLGAHVTAVAQRKGQAKTTPKIQTQRADELKKLRDQYLYTTKEYKARLEKLL